MLFLILFITAFVFYLWNKRNARPTEEPPLHPGALPLIGHGHLILGDSKKFWEILVRENEKAMSVANATTTINVTLLMAGRKYYCLTDPDDCLTVANASLEKDNLYTPARSCFGDGLVTAHPETWKEHRKLLNPEFNLNYLLTLLGVFNKQSRNLVKEFETKLEKGEFELEYVVRDNEMKTICLTAMGLDFNEDEDTVKEYENAFHIIMNSYVEQLQKIWLHMRFFWKRSNLKIIRNANGDIVHRIIDTIIKRKKADYNNTLISRNCEKDRNFKPLLDVLFDIKKAGEEEVMTDKCIRDHVNTMIFAGHDTISVTLSLALQLIGTYPDVQDKLHAELQEIFDGSDRDVEKDDLTKLVYLDAVLKETMRLYPIGPLLARYLRRDVKLKNYTLKAGHACLLNVYAVNRHPVWGRDAGLFRPERWLDPSKLPSNPNTFMTFSIGKRSCIGRAYAMISMKTTLAHILRRYRINSDISKLQLKFEILLRPAAGNCISLEKR